MAVTKSNVVVLDWLALPVDSIRGAGSVGDAAFADLSLSLAAGITVTVAHDDGNANANGVEVIVEVQYGNTDEDWRDLYVLRMGAGTATVETFNDATVGASDTTFVTTGTSMSTQGEKWFISDGTVANSEMVRVRSISSNTVTVVDGLTNAHANSLSLTNGVDEKYFPIPADISSIRVLFNNDDATAAMVVRVDLGKMTAAA